MIIWTEIFPTNATVSLTAEQLNEFSTNLVNWAIKEHGFILPAKNPTYIQFGVADDYITAETEWPLANFLNEAASEAAYSDENAGTKHLEVLRAILTEAVNNIDAKAKKLVEGA